MANMQQPGETRKSAGIFEYFKGSKLIIPLTVIRGLDGDLRAAAMLCLAAYLSSLKQFQDGWFDLPQKKPKTAKNGVFGEVESWENSLGLSETQQEAVREKLIKKGLLEVKRRGIPAKLCYRVDLQFFHSFFGSEFPGNTETEESGRKDAQSVETSRDEPLAQGSLETQNYSITVAETGSPSTTTTDPSGKVVVKLKWPPNVRTLQARTINTIDLNPCCQSPNLLSHMR